VGISVREIEELDGDFRAVGGDLGGSEEEVQETGVAGFEGWVGGDVRCAAIGGGGSRVCCGIRGSGGLGVFRGGVHLELSVQRMEEKA
jgi:hypothetical protein